MTNKILVVYATRAGSTVEVADFVGKTLAKYNTNVDVKPVQNVTSLTGYTAIVIGSGIRAGKLYSEIIKFVKQHKNELENIPTIYFVDCMTLKEDNEKNRKIVYGYLDPLRAEVKPVAAGLFAGKMDYSKLGFFPRFIVKNMVKVPEGDFRNWNAIEAWTTALLPKLKVKTD